MSHYCIVVPDYYKLKNILKMLHKLGVQRENMRLTIENENHRDMAQMLDKNVFKTTDLLNSLVRGAIIGGIIGFITGLLIKHQFYSYFFSETNIVLTISIFGLVFGAWTSSLIGISVPNAEVKKFERALDKGAILLWIEAFGIEKPELLGSLKFRYPDIIVINK